LQDMIDTWRTRHPDIDIRYVLDEEVEEAVDSAKIHLFRIVQECLTNIAKHARAKTVRIELGLLDEGQIRLVVRDDGCGFDPSQPRAGFGLHGVAERVASLDGSFSLRTTPGLGVSLEIQIPSEKPLL